MTTPDVDQAQLELYLGASAVARYFDEDGDGAADASIVEQYLALASAIARDMLVPFSAEAVDLVRSNERYARLVCTIAIAERALARPEWMLPTGQFPYEVQAKQARQDLTMIARGLERMVTADGNPMMAGSSKPDRLSTDELIFAKSSRYPSGRGGF